MGLDMRCVPEFESLRSLESYRIPEGVPGTIVEVKKTLLITDQEVPSIEEYVPRPEDILQQLALGQLRSPSIAQERGLLAYWGHQ